MSNERLDRMNDKLRQTTIRIDTDRAKLATEAYHKFPNFTPVMQRAKVFEYILDHMKIDIRDDELLVGSQTTKIRGVPVFPEYGAKWILNEIDMFNTRGTDPILVTPEDKAELVPVLESWGEDSFDEKAKKAIDPYILQAEKCGVLSVGARTTGMGHISPLYKHILPIGLDGVIKEAEAKLKTFQPKTAADIKKIDFWKASILSCKAVIRFAERYSKLAAEMAKTEKDAKRREELLKISEICAYVPKNEPRNFWEALQFTWFIHLTIQIEDNGHSIAFGRLDQNLYPYYKKDVVDGTFNKEDADELLACLYVKTTENIKLRDAFDSLAFAGYPLWQQMAIGGQKPDGTDATNELTFACFRAWELVHTTQPSMSFRVHDNTPEDIMQVALSATQRGYAIPAFYNDNLIIRLIMNKGATLEDARDWTVHGCVEPYVQGLTDGRPNVGYVNVAKCIQLVLNNGYDPDAKCELGLKTGELSSFKSIDDIEKAFNKQMVHFIEKMCTNYTTVCAMHGEYAPKAFASCLVGDCIEKGKTLEEGGARYNSSGTFLVALANAADSLEAIDQLVFRDKMLTLEQFNEILLNNFEGNERLRNIILNKVPKYGNDNPHVDAFANRMARVYNEELKKYRDSRGGTYENSILSTSFNVLQGLTLGATADGRLAKEPVSDNASPMVGRDTTSPTAAIKSVASIGQGDINNGTLFNIKFDPNVIKGEQGKKVLEDVIRSYFNMDGEHIQINVVDAETLHDAQKHPENYGNLLVRVAGYSAYFIELDRSVQENIINRTAHTNIGCGC